jgi:hypothetical protein
VREKSELLGDLSIHTWSDVSAIAIWSALMPTRLPAKNSSHHDFPAIILLIMIFAQ